MRLLVPIQAAGENDSVTDTDIPDPFSLEDAVITAEESGNIAREISHLPAETRKIIYLYYAEDMKLPEIAAAMNMKLSTVKTKLYRGVNKVRKMFARKGVNDNEKFQRSIQKNSK